MAAGISSFGRRSDEGGRRDGALSRLHMSNEVSEVKAGEARAANGHM